MALLPPGKGGGEGVARGGKGKGSLIHSLTESREMPLAHRPIPTKRDERGQVLPLFDAVKVHTGARSRPRKRLKVIATGTGDDAQPSGSSDGGVGAAPGFPSGAGRRKKLGWTDQTSGPTLSSGAHLCLVPVDVSPLGAPVGAHDDIL